MTAFRILQKKIAYAIMAVGKMKREIHSNAAKTPEVRTPGFSVRLGEGD